MSGDETYLESFIEDISTLPNEVKRNLELMRDLDKTCSHILGRLREAEAAHVQRAEEKILSLRLPPEILRRPAAGSSEGAGGESEAGAAEGGGKRKEGGKGDDDKVGFDGTEEGTSAAEAEKSQQRRRQGSDAKGLDGDGEGEAEKEDGGGSGQKQSLRRKRRRSGSPAASNDAGEGGGQERDRKRAKRSGDRDDDDDDDAARPSPLLGPDPYDIYWDGTEEDLRNYVPTTEELRGVIFDADALEQIARYRRDVRQQAEEKVSIAEQSFSLVDETVKRLDADLVKFEALLKGSGEFEATTGGAKPNDLAAIQVTPNTQDWILAKVISQDPETGIYKLADEDVESNKIYNLPESQVVVLGGVDRLSRGDMIYAVYPDTTSFYQATVAQPPRKVSGGESFVMVNFKDDADEHGITHDKAVLMKHVMRVPYVLA